MARRPSSQPARDLLEGSAALDGLGRGHALLQGANLKLVSRHKGHQVQLAIFERGISSLRGDASRSMHLGALLHKRIAAGVVSRGAALLGGGSGLSARGMTGSHLNGKLESLAELDLLIDRGSMRGDALLGLGNFLADALSISKGATMSALHAATVSLNAPPL